MWNKIIKEVKEEVKEERVAGPFEQIPYHYFVQSPIGLVPKANNKTRLIFHLSFDFGSQESSKSVNYFIPKELCSVKYNDLDAAIAACLETRKFMRDKLDLDDTYPIFFGKSDALSAFRMLPLSRTCWYLLVFMAEDPCDNKLKFFVDKCLPFGSSISCTLYQEFSDAVAHIIRTKETRVFGIINYLDNFLFIEITHAHCNALIQQFLKLCEEISLPISSEKTEWVEPIMIFLGNLLDGRRMIVGLPLDKQEKAFKLLNDFQGKRKATVKQLQVLTGYLNFLTQAIFVGCAFTRRIYAKYASSK